MFHLIEKLMGMKTAGVGVAVACLLTGCISTMQGNSIFLEQFGSAVAQGGPELSISALRSITPPDQDSRIKVQAAIAFLALSDQTTPFLLEARELRSLTRDKPLHQLEEPVQVLLYLGQKVDGEDNGNAVATREIKNTVDELCDAESDFGLSQRIEDVSELNALVFRRAMVLACAGLIKDERDVVSRHLMEATVSRGATQTCGLGLGLGQVSSSTLVVKWMECHLQQESGIGMTTLLDAGGAG